ncbi:MCE family protein [Actinomycetospora sp. CA-101289]|uniref:MCE family protein n=1 Tax=Actinomycetospora sp. CA-101289 TaxID=3239893 RepID=UPI003D960FFA
MPRMKPFRKRNPLPIGAASLAILLLLMAASLNIKDLPLIGQGPTYTARFSESAGVLPDDDVRVAGIRVGTVTDLTLEGKDVLISFKAPDAWIGDRTSASIEIKTVLGQKYIELEPAGDTPLDPDQYIPRERTRAPFDVIQAFSQLSTTVEDINTDRLAQSLGVLSDTLDGAAGPVRGALDGLSRLSRTISSRDQELARLLANTRTTTQVLADRDAEVERLINDGNLLLSELRSRKAAIDNLLNGTVVLSQQLRGLVADNEATLRPTLEQLDGVLTTLETNSANLENTIRLFAPFARVFGNVVGNGRWFDAYICNLDPPGDQNCDPGSSLDPGSLLGGLDPAVLLRLLQNALAQLGVPAIPGADQLGAVLGGLSPAQLTQLQQLLGGTGGLTPEQLGVLFPGGIPDLSALLGALQPGAGGGAGLLPGAAPAGGGGTPAGGGAGTAEGTGGTEGGGN